MPVTGTLPYDLNNLLGGAARVLTTDDAVTLPDIPANIEDVFSCETPYTPKTGWVDVGATTDASEYTRDLETEGYEIEQSTGLVFEEVTESTRTLSFEMGEIKPEHIKIMEEAPSIATIAAVAGESVAQKQVKFGSISSLTKRRVCLVGMRNKGSGLVEETTGALERGRFVLVCLYNVTISADASQISVGKGNLASMPLTLAAHPEDGQAQGQEFGSWFMEDAGTIA